MTLPDIIAQASILALIMLALAHRHSLEDFTDNWVEKMIRIDENAAEAAEWLAQMKVTK